MITKVKLEDKSKIIACRHNVPEWSEGSACVMLKPCLQYCDSDEENRTVVKLACGTENETKSWSKQELLDSIIRLIDKHNLIEFTIRDGQYSRGEISIETTMGKVNKIFKLPY